MTKNESPTTNVHAYEGEQARTIVHACPSGSFSADMNLFF